MHGRRYFEQANTEGAKAGKTLAEVSLKYYQKFYDLEEEYQKTYWIFKRPKIRNGVNTYDSIKFKVVICRLHSANYQ